MIHKQNFVSAESKTEHDQLIAALKTIADQNLEIRKLRQKLITQCEIFAEVVNAQKAELAQFREKVTM